MPPNILFLGDNHYQSYGARAIAGALDCEYRITYLEDNYGEALLDIDLSHFDFLITAAIGDTPEAPHAPSEAEGGVQSWLSTGIPILLLHGGSATFWRWSWWRALTGLRWVRREDPDGLPASIHPVCEYKLQKAKGRHPLMDQLREIDVPTDEIYTKLAGTRPFTRLMETTLNGETHTQAYSSINDWGAPVLGYLPGHKSDIAASADNIANIRAMIQYAWEATHK